MTINFAVNMVLSHMSELVATLNYTINVAKPVDQDRISMVLDTIHSGITPEVQHWVSSLDAGKIRTSSIYLSDQLDAYKKEQPDYTKDQAICRFFNNWFFHLPSAQFGNKVSYFRQTSQEAHTWNTPNSVIYSQYESIKKNRSSLWLEQSSKEFHSIIDACVVAEKLSFKKIIDMNKEGITGYKDFAKLYNYTFPVFSRLLALGYYKNDLT